MLLLPPTQPSPMGEGVKINHFPLEETGKGVSSEKLNTILTILTDKGLKFCCGFEFFS